MIGAWPVWGFLKGIPWQVWAGIALLIAFWWWGNHREAQGRDAILEQLREAEANAAIMAKNAADSADANERDRAADFEAEREVLEEAIQQAEASGGNALDALF
tara:strand:+ start:453 stop:761 length:309 start_codon:yes stop_codon:yes gene_type:complete